MIKTIAIPQYLLNEKARLDFADVAGMDATTLAQHNADRAANNAELAKYGDIPMTSQEISARQAEEAANIISQALEEMRSSAKRGLIVSDMVAIRCIKAGVAFPADWQAYVAALRAISSTGIGPLPVQPAYPVGTQ